MYDTLNRGTRQKIYQGYKGGGTLRPSELLGQRNLRNQFANMERPNIKSETTPTPPPTPQPTPSPYSRMPLQVGLDVSYARDEGEIIRKLAPYGYSYDTSLSTKENKVLYSPFDDKVVMTVAGTDPFNRRDLGTDAYLAFRGQSGLKQTDRYKEAKSVLSKVREKYKGKKKTLIAHSLGSSIINTLANEEENVKGFGTGSGIFGTTRQSDLIKPRIKKGNLRGSQDIVKKTDNKKTENYRTFFDPFSFTSSDTIIAPYKPEKKGNLRGNQVVDYPSGIFPSHSYQNLKNKNIFV